MNAGEIQIELDRNKLNSFGIPALTVANQLQSTGMNMPVGKHDTGTKETVFRAIGVFENLKQIENTPVMFSGDANNSVTVKRLGSVSDGTQEKTSITYIYERDKKSKDPSKGKTTPAIFLEVFKQSGTNTVAVSDRIIERIAKINEEIKDKEGHPRIIVGYDGAQYIRGSIHDVKYTMLLGILFAVVVVYLFLGNIRSTIITGIAIPNSLLGAFLLMYAMGFTLNMLTLLALSLTVGLLVDDAIVVRENIFRKLQSGMSARRAAEVGTSQVMLAVIATSLTVIAVFFPIAFMKGTIGKYFLQFGLTIVFAMCVSLFDALTVAPFLSAYFAGSGEKSKNFVVRAFDRFQDKIDQLYAAAVDFSIKHPLIIILVSLSIFASSIFVAMRVPSTFMPDDDNAEFQIELQMPEGTSLNRTLEVAKIAESEVKKFPELNFLSVKVESNKASISVIMAATKDRKRSADAIREELRKKIAVLDYAKPSVNLYGGGSSWKPFVLNISGQDFDELNEYAMKVFEKLKKVSDLTEVEIAGQGGKPEFQVQFDSDKMQGLGVTTKMAGDELRYQIAGGVVGKLHQNGKEYDVRLRLKPDQRNLKSAYSDTRVPNMNGRLIPLSAIANGKDRLGPTQIMRQNRNRTIQIMANYSENGSAGGAMEKAKKIFEKDLPLPKSITYNFWGDSEALTQTMEGIILAFALSMIFIFLILSSLYESFISPITILLAIPPALSGAFFALKVTGEMLSIFSMIGIILLMGLVIKNSILLVDFAVTGVRNGLSRKEAIRKAGIARLRPILMTTFAMIAGTTPVALGLGEAGKQQASMGIAIIGGLIVSTLITLLVVPAVFEYADIFREFVEKRFRPLWRKEEEKAKGHAEDDSVSSKKEMKISKKNTKKNK